jgi:hypothetical protein
MRVAQRERLLRILKRHIPEGAESMTDDACHCTLPSQKRHGPDNQATYANHAIAKDDAGQQEKSRADCLCNAGSRR